MTEPTQVGLGPDEAIEQLAERLASVGVEVIPPQPGRVLAAPIRADRDSPAADVSAMDGYAARSEDLRRSPDLPVAGEVQAGMPAGSLPAEGVLRIFTGAVIPSGTELVIRREDVVELGDRIRWTEAACQQPVGANIRRRGENAAVGATVLTPGSRLTAASIATVANFGASQVTAFRRVAVSVIVTGNELLGIEAQPEPWQLRDSNGPTVAALLTPRSWLELLRVTRCGDRIADLRSLVDSCLQDSDAVILTGGVSKGDHDHVPAVLGAAGCETLFHRLPIRPGQPVFGGLGPRGQLVLGLPGNPVSTACCLARIGLPLLDRLSGCQAWRPRPSSIEISNPDGKCLPLHWMRLAALPVASGHPTQTLAELLPSRGSGDLVALGRSDGFIEQPPGQSGRGPWNWYPW